MLLSTILFVVLLARASLSKQPSAYGTPNESTHIEKKDGNCSPEVLLLKSQLSAAGVTVGRRYRYLVDVAKRLPKRYFGDHIPWKKLKSFSIRNDKLCSECYTIKHYGKIIAVQYKNWLTKTIRDEKRKNRKFKATTIFRDDAGKLSKLWDNQILETSTVLAPLYDQANYFVNKMVRDISGFEKKSLRELSQKIPCQAWTPDDSWIHNLNITELVKNLTRSAQKTIRKENPVEKLRNSLEGFYDNADKSNNTMIRALVKGLPRNDFTDLVHRLTDSLHLLALSPDVAPGIVLVVKATVDNFSSIDFNRLWVLGYASFLRVRLALQHVDVAGILKELHRLALAIQKGWWLLFNGQWPALELYFNKLARTVASDGFWDRAEMHYNRTVHHLHEIYERRTEKFEAFVVKRLRPLAVETIEYIERFSNEVDVSFKRIADDVRQLDVGGALESALKKLVDETTKRYLTCYTKKTGFPDFMMFGMHDGSYLKKILMDLFFRDWPKKKITPKGADAFFQKLANAFNMIITYAVGECP